MQGVVSSNLTAPTRHQLQPVNTSSVQGVNKPHVGQSDPPLAATSHSFLRSSAHKSLKTVETLRERLSPFMDYLSHAGVDDSLGHHPCAR